MMTAIYPGSFDPVTNGHLNIIRRAAACFDRLIVCVLVNSDKRPMFSPQERMDMIRRVTQPLENVEVCFYGGLLADFARQQNCRVLVKGLRSFADYEREAQMARINRNLNHELDTVFFTADERYACLSSSAVKELARYGASLSDYLPQAIIEDFLLRLNEQTTGGISHGEQH